MSSRRRRRISSARRRARSAASRLLLGLLRGARGGEIRHGAVGGAGGHGGRQLGRLVVAEPEVAHPVDLGELRLAEQAAEDEPAVDERGALVALRRDGVDAADPRRAVRVDAQRALAQLGGGEAEDAVRGRVRVAAGRRG